MADTSKRPPSKLLRSNALPPDGHGRTVTHEQRKVIKYNHLVANMVILHNVVGMSRVLKQLQAEGVLINQEVLAGLAPYRMEHINRFGDYVLDFRRKVEVLADGFRILEAESAA